MKRIAVYARTSGGGDGKDGPRVKRQAEAVAEWVRQRYGVEPCEIYCDGSQSGFYYSRPRFNALLAAMVAGDVDMIAANYPDRVSRDWMFSERLKHVCDLLGVEIVFAQWGSAS